MYAQGDWVEIKHHYASGYVLESDHCSALVCVIKNGRIQGNKRFNHYEMNRTNTELLPEDTKDLTQLYINMALDSDDKSWFRSLTNGSMEESK